MMRFPVDFSRVVRFVREKVVVRCFSSNLGNSGSTCGRFRPKCGRTRKVGSDDMDFYVLFVWQLGYRELFDGGILSSALPDYLMSGWGNDDGVIQDWKDFEQELRPKGWDDVEMELIWEPNR
ncbi:hypothetical protein L1887_05021 [Cichorium endivia]|nr:hypothetical protein L1887_05021 [Cichorium endivia]